MSLVVARKLLLFILFRVYTDQYKKKKFCPIYFRKSGMGGRRGEWYSEEKTSKDVLKINTSFLLVQYYKFFSLNNLILT